MFTKHPFKLYRFCLICNKKFPVKSSKKNQKYCCIECAHVGRKTVKEKTCVNCGIVFKSYYKKSRFCCKECKNQYLNKINNTPYFKNCEFCKSQYLYYNNMSNWFKEGQIDGKKYHGVDSSKYCCYECGIAHRQETSKNTCKIKYGVEFTAASKNNLDKSKQTKLKRYGNPTFTNPEKVKQTFNLKSKEEKLKIMKKVETTKLLKYGDKHYNGNKKYTETELQEIQEKIYLTFKKNNSFRGKGKIDNSNCSLAEETIYNRLITKYSKVEYNKFIRGYGKCDFYIVDLDLYIEYQGTWTHGGKVFENTLEDLNKIQKWKSKNSAYYDQAVYTWTKLDVKKRKFAIENNLNWIEFFSMNEFENWFKNI